MNCIYGQVCCFDFNSTCSFLSQLAYSKKNTKFLHLSECFIIDRGNKYGVVTKCSNMTNCQRRENNFIDQIPVQYKLIRSILFLNKNCALCNGITDVEFLDFKVNLMGENEMNSSDYTISDIILLYKSDIKEFSIKIAFSNFTQCFPGKFGICKDCKNSNIVDYCEKTQAITTIDFHVFKNPFCVNCDPNNSKLNFDLIECRYLHVVEGIIPFSYSYNFMFKLSEYKENTKSICEVGEIYVKTEKTCRKVIRKTSLIELIRPQECILNLTIDEIDEFLNVCSNAEILKSIIEEFKLINKGVHIIEYSNFNILRNETFIKEHRCHLQIKLVTSKKLMKHCSKLTKNHLIRKFNTTFKIKEETYLNEDGKKIRELMDSMCPEYIEYESKLLTLNSSQSIIYENNTFICKIDLENMSEIIEMKELVKKNKKKSHYLAIIGMVCLVISELFLIFFLIALPRKIKKLSRAHWQQWLLALSLFFWLLCTLLSPILRDWKVPCQIVAVSGHFFFMSVILWQSIIAVNLFFNFRNESIIPQNWFCTCKTWKLAALVYFSSLIFPAIGIVLQQLDIGGKGKVFYGTGENDNCWIYGFTGQIVLMILPFFTIWSFNCILLGMTIFNLSKLIENSPISRIKMKREVMIYVKLALIFGVSWILSLLSSQITHDVIIFFNIMVNSLQGLWLVLAVYQFKTNQSKTATAISTVK